MPIYEYQCEKCKRICNFLVRNVAAHKAPICPKCGHPKMTRAFSRFAPIGGSKTQGRKDADDAKQPGGPPAPNGGPMPDMSMLDGVDENDPRSMGRALRAMSEQAGEMDEVVRRLEAGEDPAKIEEKMGDLLGDEGQGGMPGSGGVDNTLYEG